MRVKSAAKKRPKISEQRYERKEQNTHTHTHTQQTTNSEQQALRTRTFLNESPSSSLLRCEIISGRILYRLLPTKQVHNERPAKQLISAHTTATVSLHRRPFAASSWKNSRASSAVRCSESSIHMAMRLIRPLTLTISRERERARISHSSFHHSTSRSSSAANNTVQNQVSKHHQCVLAHTWIVVAQSIVQARRPWLENVREPQHEIA